MAFIDIRGPHPVYINGLIAVELTGEPLGITVEMVEGIATSLPRGVSDFADYVEITPANTVT